MHSHRATAAAAAATAAATATSAAATSAVRSQQLRSHCASDALTTSGGPCSW